MSTQEDVAVEERIEIKEPSKYKVIIHDNPTTSYEEVIFIISRCFEKSEDESLKIAQDVDSKGKGVCGIYTKEIAEAKMVLVDMAKQFLISRFVHRLEAISALKFTLEEE